MPYAVLLYSYIITRCGGCLQYGRFAVALTSLIPIPVDVYDVQAVTAHTWGALCSVTIPAHCVYSLIGSANYSNSVPLYAKFIDSGSLPAYEWNNSGSLGTRGKDELGLYPTAVVSGYTGNSAITLILCGYYYASANNSGSIKGFYIKMS